MQKTANGTLKEEDVKFSKGAAACVIMASNGYPEAYEKGYEITVDSDIESQVYIAGAVLKDGKMLTSGGRVLGVTATADTLKAAIDKAYKDTNKVHFGNSYMRHDIGAKALACLEDK